MCGVVCDEVGLGLALLALKPQPHSNLIIAEYHPEYHVISHENPNISSRENKTAPRSLSQTCDATLVKVCEEVLERGDADLVSMARPFLADADIVNKAAAGRAADVNTCIGCNQACLDHTFKLMTASCLVGGPTFLSFSPHPPALLSRLSYLSCLTALFVVPALSLSLCSARLSPRLPLPQKNTLVHTRVEKSARCPARAFFFANALR